FSSCSRAAFVCAVDSADFCAVATIASACSRVTTPFCTSVCSRLMTVLRTSSSERASALVCACTATPCNASVTATVVGRSRRFDVSFDVRATFLTCSPSRNDLQSNRLRHFERRRFAHPTHLLERAFDLLIELDAARCRRELDAIDVTALL